MIKLLDYKNEGSFTELIFENNQWVKAYKFGNGIYLETSDHITKTSVKNVKQKLQKDGLDADLSEFIGLNFKECGEI